MTLTPNFCDDENKYFDIEIKSSSYLKHFSECQDCSQLIKSFGTKDKWSLNWNNRKYNINIEQNLTISSRLNYFENSTFLHLKIK